MTAVIGSIEIVSASQISGVSEIAIASGPMSARLDPSWSVVSSPSTPSVDRCVDIFKRSDGTFGFEEFRRDAEDLGGWTPIAYYSGREFATEAEAVGAARAAVPWRSEVLDGGP